MSIKQKNLTIRKTANLTSRMRNERATETFEDTSATSASDRSKSAESSSRKPGRQSREEASKRVVRIQKEEVVKYDAELASLYERSCDTRSMNSISELENVEEFEKKCEESKRVGPQLIPVKYVTTHVDTPNQAVFVSDFEICEIMNNPKSVYGQSKKVEFSVRFEVENKFLEDVVADVDKLLAMSGRMDVEVKVVKTRDDNGSPRCLIQLIRRIKAESAGSKVEKHSEVYGFDAPDLPVASGTHQSSKIAPAFSWNSNVFAGIVGAVKRRLGF